MKCPSCGVECMYPMSTIVALAGWLIVLGACTGLLVGWLTDPNWKPPVGGIWLLLLLFLMIQNRRLWRALRLRAQQSNVSFVPMQPPVRRERGPS